jgi:NAD(P)H-quinone oxidoreductase subunit 5
MPMPISLFAPLLLLAVAVLFRAAPGRRPGRLPVLAEAAALGALGLTLAGAVQLALLGPQTFSFGAGAFLLDVRLDLIAVTMTVLVGFVGWVVVRNARTALDGEAREGAFHGWMLATIAAVLVLVQAGSLAVLIAGSVAVGAGLRQLQLFYATRPAARRAAAKFTLVWGMGDAALVAAAVLLWLAFGTADIAAITAAVTGGLPMPAAIATGLLVLAALFKTAAFPLHGWLTEVMEAPTPVSALLHA